MMGSFNWIFKYEIFDILHQAELIFSEKKDSIEELIDYFSFQKDLQIAQKSEIFQTASLISKTVLIMLRTTIPFKDPLNQDILQKNQANNIDNKESLKRNGQSPQLKSSRQFSDSQNLRSNLEKDELWTEQSESSANGDSNYYLKLRGIPYNAKEIEVQEFLGIQFGQGQLVFKYDKEGKFTGENFIKAKDQAQFDYIKSMHKKTMQKRYIEIFVADKSDFLQAQESLNINDNSFYLSDKGVLSNYGTGLGQLIQSNKKESENQVRDKKKSHKKEVSRSRSSRSRDKYSESSSRNSNSFSSSPSSHNQTQESQSDSKYSKSSKSDSYHYIRLRGLPFNAREAEIQEFLGISLNSNQITFKHDNDGRFSGECVIRTKDQNQLEKIKDMHMKNMGKRYIEIFLAEKSDFVRAQDSQSVDDQKGSISQINSQIDSNLLQTATIVKIRGLPYTATDQDIQNFFKDSQILQNGIQKVYDGKRPSGEAFILFATMQDAQNAIKKDKGKMGSRYIEIFLSHIKEFTNHIKKRKSYPSSNSYSNGGSSSSSTTNKYSNHGSRYDKFHNQGGYSNHGRNNKNEGKFNNHNSRYSNSPPHRSYGSNNGNNHNNSNNGQGFYKKGMNGNYDRHTKGFSDNQNSSKFSNGEDRFNGNYNNGKGYNNHNNNYGNKNNNNYQNDYSNRGFRNQGKEEQGKYGGSNNYANKQFDSNHQNQSQQNGYNQMQANHNQQQQSFNKNQGGLSGDGNFYGGRYDYQYQNQQQNNSSQMNQQQSSAYPQENNQHNNNYSNNSSNDSQQQYSQNQSNQQQNYYNNSNQGQYQQQQQQQQYQNQHFNSNNQYDSQHQPANYNQYNNQNHPQQYSNNYYNSNQQDRNQQQQNHANIGQQGHQPHMNGSHNSQPHYYQQNMFDVQSNHQNQQQNQQQQYRYY